MNAVRKPLPATPQQEHPGLGSSHHALRQMRRQREQQPSAALMERVRREFDEMRGFSPTCSQAARLFGLSLEECDVILTSLMHEGFLHLSDDGRYRVTV